MSQTPHLDLAMNDPMKLIFIAQNPRHPGIPKILASLTKDARPIAAALLGKRADRRAREAARWLRKTIASWKSCGRIPSCG